MEQSSPDTIFLFYIHRASSNICAIGTAQEHTRLPELVNVQVFFLLLQRTLLSQITVTVTVVSRLRMEAGGNCGQQMSVKSRGLFSFVTLCDKYGVKLDSKTFAYKERHNLGSCSESSYDLTYEDQ